MNSKISNFDAFDKSLNELLLNEENKISSTAAW
jgi:hypothetical protein